MRLLDRIKKWMKQILGKEKKEAIEEAKTNLNIKPQEGSYTKKTDNKESYIEAMKDKMAKENGNKIETPICPGDGTGILHEVKF